MAIDVADARTPLTVGASLDHGYTLPAAWYTSPAVFAQEQERIFRRFWQYVGYREQVSNPGDFITCALGHVPIVVLRDGAGVLRAFANVQRDRGARLVREDEGDHATIRCRYHGWTWDLDGTPCSTPQQSEHAHAHAQEAFPLVPLLLETWGPLLFVNPDPHAGPLSAVLGELPAIVAATG